MKLSLLSHLDELRSRIIKISVFFLIFFLISYVFSNKIIFFLQNSILKNIELIVLTPYEFIVAKFSLSIFLSIFLSIPIIVYQLVLYIKPALKKKEKRFLVPITISSFILFIIGMFFGYMVLLKIGIRYLASLSMHANVVNLWSFGGVINFVFFTILITGLIFQLPLIVVLLDKLNIVNKATLKQKRVYIYVFIFIFAAILTPPDPITQLLIAVPLILLFEISFILIRIL